MRRAGRRAEHAQVFRFVADAHLGAKQEFAQASARRGPPVRAAARRKTRRAHGAPAPSSAITRPCALCKPASVLAPGDELLGVSRKLTLQEARGVDSTKCQHAEPTGARQIDTNGAAHLCFCSGFMWSKRCDSGRICARAECPFRRRSHPQFRRSRTGRRARRRCRRLRSARRTWRTFRPRAHALRRLGKEWPLHRLLSP